MVNHYKHFGHLHVPDSWEQYWSKYPNGYSMMEALINWVGQVNNMVDSVNENNEHINCLQRNFNALDKELRASWKGYKDSTEKTYKDFRDEVYTIINNWIATIEPTIQDEVVKSLSAWLKDGTLADIINKDVFDMKANQTDLDEVTAQLAQTDTQIKKLENVSGKEISLEDYIDFATDKELERPEWDWSNALEKAIDDAIKTGSMLYVNGNYKIKRNSKINVFTNNYFYLKGKDIVKTKLTFTGIDGGLVFGNGIDYLYEVKLKDICIDGDYKANTLLTFHRAEQFFFDNVMVEKAKIGMSLNRTSLTHFTRFTARYCDHAIQINESCGMVTLDKYDFWDNKSAITFNDQVTRLNLLDGWGEHNGCVLTFSDVPTNKHIGLITVKDSRFLENASKTTDKFINVELEKEYGLTLIMDNVDLHYPNSIEPIMDFSKKGTGFVYKVSLILNNLSVPTSLTEERPLVKSHATQQRHLFDVEIAGIRGKENKKALFNGSGELIGQVSRYGNNTFYNGIKLSSENLTSDRGRLYFDEGLTRFLGYLETGKPYEIMLHKKSNGVPTDGTYRFGEIVYNSVPVPGSYLGWVCINGGSPGLWKGFGTIQS